jgi:uncharacterized membrane protein YhiD involved in acid resistance
MIKKNKKGFVSLTFLNIFLLLILVFSFLVSSLIQYYDLKNIQHYQIEANSFINAEQNLVLDKCKNKDYFHITYYKDFNYNQKIKFDLICNYKMDINGPYISYVLKGCRNENYVVNDNNKYNICLEKKGKIYL